MGFCAECGTWTDGKRCATHARIDPRIQRRARDGRNLASWQRTRAAVLERDDHHCTTCHRPAMIGDPLSVHRIGGGYHDADTDRYRTMHRSCHARHEAASRGTRRISSDPPQGSTLVRSFWTDIEADCFGNGAA